MATNEHPGPRKRNLTGTNRQLLDELGCKREEAMATRKGPRNITGGLPALPPQWVTQRMAQPSPVPGGLYLHVANLA